MHTMLLDELTLPPNQAPAVGNTVTILITGAIKGVQATVLELHGERRMVVRFQKRTLAVRKTIHGQWEEV